MAKIDPMKIPLPRTFLDYVSDAAVEYFKDPANREAYEKWKADPETQRRHGTFLKEET